MRRISDTGMGSRALIAAMLALTVALSGCANVATNSTPEAAAPQTPTAESTPASPPEPSTPTSEPEAQPEEHTEGEANSEPTPTEEHPETEKEAPSEAEHGGFCSTHSCIPSYEDGNGYPVECADGEWSKSGGIQGACSDHGGEKE